MIRRWNQGSEQRVFDWFTVGGGSAGAVIASRLSENPNVTVLLLEAGEEETKEPKIDIPLAVAELQLTPYDWQYLTEPQGKACLAMKNEVIPLKVFFVFYFCKSKHF